MSSPVKLNTNTSPSTSVWAVQATIGHAIGALLSLGVFFLDFTSLGAAFVSGCPFRSPFSAFIRFVFEKLKALSQRIPREYLSSERLRWLWIALWVASDAVVGYATTISGTWFALFFLPATVPIAYSALQEVDHKPQKYKLSLLATWVFITVSLSMILAIYFEYPAFIPLYTIGVLGLAFACWMFSKMSKSMVETGEIDALAWLLITIPPQDPATFFKIAGQMTRAGSSGFDYRPRLLESLLPLLTLLITSHNTHSTNEDSHLEIYIACLARLSEFTDDKGTFWCLREDAKQHPMLDQKLINKLVELADSPHDFQGGLKDAAANVLYNYRLNTNGIPLENPITDESTVLEITADARNATMLNVTGNRSNNQDRGRLPAESQRLLGQTMHEVPVQSSEESEEMRWRRRG